MRDSGSIVLGWLIKLVVGLSLLGVLSYDGVQLVVANVDAADDASTAANAAADTFHSTKNIQMAYDAAVAAVAGKGDTVETTTFSIAPDGLVSLTIDRTPHTLWMHRLGFLRHATHIRQSGTAIPAT